MRQEDEETKGYGDYNWEELYKSGNLNKLKVAELNKYIFRHNLSRRKMSKSVSAHQQRFMWKDLDTECCWNCSNGRRVSKDSESEDELLWEFGDARNSNENDSKDSESEEEDKLPEGARINCYDRKVGNWRLRYSS